MMDLVYRWFMNNIIKKYNIKDVKELKSGWSKDKKYILDDKYLLRISDGSLYNKKKEQFELLKEVDKLSINSSKPIEFGVLDSGDVYMLLSYLDGYNAIDEISKLDNKSAYDLGFEAGLILQKIHSISINKKELSWYDKYVIKMERKINNYLKCEYKISYGDSVIEYYKKHCYLMKNRPLTLTHGDYHLGNMIINNNHIGIIDFDKLGLADPYDEFKPFCWNVMRNEYFETGLINGYFNNKIPEDFFPILKFYTAESLISHITWAVTFGEEEIKTAYEISNLQSIWWDDFKLDIPTWYKGIL